MNTPEREELPDLPEAAASFRYVTACERQLVFPGGYRDELGDEFYTADQMRAYGRLCRAGRGDGVSMIAAERRRQIEAEGWTPDHDDEHDTEEMAKAAAVYATPRADRDSIFWKLWPWHDSWWKPGGRIRELVKAGALIAAEIDRLRRLSPQAGGEK